VNSETAHVKRKQAFGDAIYVVLVPVLRHAFGYELAGSAR
jgi:hypothetical protein